MDAPFKYYLTAAVAVMFYALLSPIVRKMSLGNFPPFAFMMIANAVLLILSAIGYFVLERSFALTSIQPITWMWLLGFGCLNFVGYYLYVRALSGMPITHYQLIGMSTPIFGGLFAWYLLKEPISPKLLAGFIIMCLGFYIAIAKKPFAFIGVN